MKTKEIELAVKIIGFLIALPVTALILYWSNYLFFRPYLPWYSYLLFGSLIIYIQLILKPFAKILPVIFIAACAIQILAWNKIIILPLFK